MNQPDDREQQICDLKGDKFDRMSFCGSLHGETFSKPQRITCKLSLHSPGAILESLRAGVIHNERPEKRINNFFNHYRYLVAILGGLSFGCMMILRFNIAVAILNMVDHENMNNTLDELLSDESTIADDEKFDWDNEIQGMIMSWYMIAYTLPQILTTRLGLIVGPRLMTPISLSICALASILTPMVAHLGWEWVIALRLLNGLGASAILPMMVSLIESWMPYEEIYSGLTVAQLLQTLSTTTSPLIAGYLSSIHWSLAFYVPGFGVLIFCAIWLLLVADQPDKSWLISQQELDMICRCSTSTIEYNINDIDRFSNFDSKSIVSANKTGQIDGQNIKPEVKEPAAPPPKQASTIDIFKVPSFYAYLVVMSLHCSSYNGFSFILPAYLKQFLRIELSENGLYCCIIQSGSILAVIWPHPILRFLQNNLNLSLTLSRKIVYSVACLVAGLTWIYVGLFQSMQLPILFLNRCFQGSNDVIVTGSLMSNYAGSGLSSMAFSMVNTIGNFSVVFASTLIGWVLDSTDQSQLGWFWVLVILGSAQFVILMVFSLCTTSDTIEFENSNSDSDGNKNEIDS